jgi:endogenous inhibitor of DNA gyrase (YacG/DUF329 family)
MPPIKERNCPSCKAGVVMGSEFFPFCSKRCQLLDLGAWASEKYVIKGKEAELEDEQRAEDKNDDLE